MHVQIECFQHAAYTDIGAEKFVNFLFTLQAIGMWVSSVHYFHYLLYESLMTVLNTSSSCDDADTAVQSHLYLHLQLLLS